MRIIKSFALVFALFASFNVFASEEGAHSEEHNESNSEKFNPVEMIMHHISDSHDWHLWDITDENGVKHPVSIPLPVIIINNGLDVFMSSAFHHGEHPVTKGDVTYVMHHDKIYIADANGELSFDDVHHPTNAQPLDLSVTRNVASMLLSMIILFLVFSSAAKSYNNQGAPKGIGSFLEPLVVFVRDEIARPNIDEHKYEKFMPYLLTVFFFIWINNLLGLIPFFPGGSNLTGNIAFTMVLAVFTLVLTNINGNKAYWSHILTPPVPVWLYPIMIPVELIGVFTKPFALMVRLFANITAGHILILSLVSLIFIFESIGMSFVSIPFMVFMNTLELLVAALQAYIFTLLSALFIGMATEEAHH